MLNKLKQFRDLRSQAKEMQDNLSKESVTVKSAGDKVVMTMDGNLKMTGLAIDNDLLNPDKKQKLQDAIKDAHADAMKKMQRIMAMKMKEMGGLPNIPGLS
ncbi:MAG: nucleoid-associated protein, YbaB/EbfC family [Candidatus Magasanikbacteria bacterium RIFCSPHIGHO2_01_FULL_33_34]|uniref:Nucleoid-associated protein A2725_00180 n=1 Tax=Candidatus Magasanikbacteria bacterium RIFCSPHIGHO2_01_FULL_33_34 TaxID=1798671 RepID=A0A1F6LL63_9BACT|nr:MAG: nucleoid-associated protein, YbaB/EbfC family [Candidatus Magasanikbacteria bacterium RIFCSPHIGHO2_01_FULL_33_34]OGH65778.1 MAG: nucleoid-associated protein, YbaB/EbfC family [Candidatus Magasanikbacteria bacterium RIFCSPHIGHO2_02_FULL_33_17]OGH75143.1 MAG: nucleoid-associated protein, YbaB/EbfC family [Candidatus Magasanikbacteria bacterium RIFCSPLOWO2_01_FULL_33_34]OGH81221.1 MAG: nucleoid-associated protein, YbaB/EbfC family [Candidatus Magasanikbacteria bacterium RIFCSPLOWO2_12_FULL_